jgi:hypothetical protein
MYEQAQVAKSRLTQNAGTLNDPQPQMETGISSAMKELINEINENCTLADNLKSSLGMSSPEQSNAKETDTNLYGVIKALTYRMRSNNNHFGDVLRHLNS